MSTPRPIVHHGDCLAVLRTLPDESVDAVVTDPPYGLSNTDPKHVAETLTKWVTGDHEYTPPVRSGGFMGAKWDAFVPPPAVWDECMRVLKHGGHLLVFAGTRTQDLMGLSIRLAGFELRDGLGWIHSQGFPKSMDISKAIDKAAGVERTDGAREWNGGQRSAGILGTNHGTQTRTIYDIPATPEAERWSGWGTSLKPAIEPVIVARKPLGGTIDVTAFVERELRAAGVTGDIKWTTSSVSAVAKSSPMPTSGSTEPQRMAGTSAKTASDSATQPTAKPTETPIASPAAAGQPTTLTENVKHASGTHGSSATQSVQLTDRTASAAANPKTPSSPSTTSKEEGPRTARSSTARSTSTSDAKGSRPDTESFAGIATGLTGSQTHVRINRNRDGSFTWPDGLPQRVAVGSTVAANVLAHGTGGINVEACRVGTGDKLVRPEIRREDNDVFGTGLGAGTQTEPPGRFPPNVLLDPEAAAAMDEQSGVSSSRASAGRNGKDTAEATWGLNRKDDTIRGHTDSGGASRFFPVFKYQAKAPAKERPQYTAEDGRVVKHATVKPLELMRWLVRLVTPAGGVVLDPFAGSGTTGEAAMLEGFDSILVEGEAEHLPLIDVRIERSADETAASRPKAPEPEPTTPTLFDRIAACASRADLADLYDEVTATDPAAWTDEHTAAGTAHLATIERTTP